MLIPMKSHSRVKSRNSRVSIETLDFARLRDRSWITGGGVKGGAIAGQTRHRSRPMTGPHHCLWRIDIAGGGAPKTAGGEVRGSAVKRSGRSAPGGPPRRRAGESPAPRRTPLNNRSTSRGGGIHTRNGGQRPGLRRRGTRVETHAGNVMGGGDRRLGYGRPQTRRRTRLEDRPTLRAVVTFDVCCNAAVNCDLSCFLYRVRLKRPYLHCRADAVA